MANLLEEIKKDLSVFHKTTSDIALIHIRKIDEDDYGDFTPYLTLTAPITEEDLSSLNFEYDSGFGTQYIDGFITFTDNSWLQRCEYDGSEWWGYYKCPQIEDLL